jgi:putative tryptophan/tyrosine transport system substrate-binding protein
MIHFRRAILSAAALLPFAISVAHSQAETKAYRVGVVSPLAAFPEPVQMQALRRGLRELGYVEGENIILERRFAEGQQERVPHLVAELIERKVDVMVVGSSFATSVAKRATSTIPIVFAGLFDPVGPGFVASLAHPGGNITGASMGIGGSGLGGKWVQLLNELVPGAASVAVLANMSGPQSAPLVAEIRAAAKKMKIGIDVFDVRNDKDLEKSIAQISSGAARGMIVANDPYFVAVRSRLTEFAALRKLPTIYFSKLFVDAGGLLTYGASLEDSWYRAATYVDRILKGANPAALPIDQPTRFELAVNVRAATALGLKIPQSLFVRADHVIE